MTRILLIGLALLWLFSPRHVNAPHGWYVNGVRPDGAWEMRPVLGRPDDDLLDAVRRRVWEDNRRIRGRLWCTGGATPRQDGASVWCQR